MDGMTTVYAVTTGKPHRVPVHYLENPALMRGFRKTQPTDAKPETPSKSWNRDRLLDHARSVNADFADDATKDDLLAAIEAAPTTPAGTPPTGTETPA